MLIPIATLQRMQQVQDRIISAYYRYIGGAIMKLPRALKSYTYYTEADWDADYAEYIKHTQRLKRARLTHSKEGFPEECYVEVASHDMNTPDKEE